jgi:hypothetical protein
MPGRSPAPSAKGKKMEASKSKAQTTSVASTSTSAQSRRTVAAKGGASADYGHMTVIELHKKAAEVGIHGRSTMNKKELVNALRHH